MIDHICSIDRSGIRSEVKGFPADRWASEIFHDERRLSAFLPHDAFADHCLQNEHTLLFGSKCVEVSIVIISDPFSIEPPLALQNRSFNMKPETIAQMILVDQADREIVVGEIPVVLKVIFAMTIDPSALLHSWPVSANDPDRISSDRSFDHDRNFKKDELGWNGGDARARQGLPNGTDRNEQRDDLDRKVHVMDLCDRTFRR